jgi:hypothetical protein
MFIHSSKKHIFGEHFIQKTYLGIMGNKTYDLPKTIVIPWEKMIAFSKELLSFLGER